MFYLEPLPFAYDALEPYIDAGTMRLHHDKHHQTYVDKLNERVSKLEIPESRLEDLLGHKDQIIRNMAGGVYNHNLFWKFLSPDYELPTPDSKTIEQFSNSAMGLFGSGWIWLTKSNKIISTQNQDHPVIDPSDPIILCLDVWEHAYYLKYQNRRKDYIDSFFTLLKI